MTPLDRDTAERVRQGIPAWAETRRAEGWSHFEKLDMPNEKDEAWRYVELDFDIADYGLAETPGEPGADSPLADLLTDRAGTAQVVDGHTVAIEGDLPAGVRVRAIREALADDNPALRSVYDALVPADLDAFSAAHHAFSTDGVFIHVAERTTAEAPVFIDVAAATPASISFPKISISVESAAEAHIVVSFRSAQELDAVVVPQLEALVGDGAQLKISVVQDWGYGTRGIAQCRGVLGRDAGLHLAEAGVGGALSRVWLQVDLEGRGSTARVDGAYFGEGRQVLDYRYTMRHIGEHTRSDMFLKGAVEDEALSVFTGMIRIEETAQHTDSYQTNRNLILSDGAAAQSVPNLEILANDVRCGHGSTVGPLDAEQRYYLMSRGLPRSRADRLQVRGFFEEALARFPHQQLRPWLRDAINAKFISAQEEGRL